MSDAVSIAVSKKESEINTWLENNFSSRIPCEKQIFLLGLATGIHLDPNVYNQLSPRAKQYIPDVSVAYQFLIDGIETWGAYYEAYTRLKAVEGDYAAGVLSEQEALAAISAIII